MDGCYLVATIFTDAFFAADTRQGRSFLEVEMIPNFALYGGIPLSYRNRKKSNDIRTTVIHSQIKLQWLAPFCKLHRQLHVIYVNHKVLNYMVPTLIAIYRDNHSSTFDGACTCMSEQISIIFPQQQPNVLERMVGETRSLV